MCVCVQEYGGIDTHFLPEPDQGVERERRGESRFGSTKIDSSRQQGIGYPGHHRHDLENIVAPQVLIAHLPSRPLY